MKASFVIATYNRASDLERCIDSILLQQDCEFEILIIDDASPDDTCRMVDERYGDRVSLVRRDANCGSIKNRNRGAQLAQGDILFMIDDDTEVPGTQTVCEVLKSFDDTRVGAVAIPYLQHGDLRKSPPTEDQEYAVASYVGCASAVRRDLFLSLGGYDEFFHHQVEEDDLCIRMLDGGKICKIASVSQPMLHHESLIRNYWKLDYFSRRNSLLYIWKNCPALYLLPNLTVTTFRGARHAFRIKRFRGSFKGLLDGYGAICKSIFGQGSPRRPVRKAVYNASRRMRKEPQPMEKIVELTKAGDR